MNIQTGNVGNLGDILKHAALVQLALALRKCAGSDTRYIETHSFLLQAPAKNSDSWWNAASRLSESYAGYEPYVEIEQPLISRQEYCCSAGLALDLLRPSSAYLAEKNPATLQTLKAQVISEGLEGIVTLTDAADRLPMVIDGNPRCGFLMLVDPFKDPNEVWPTVSAVAETFDHRELLGAIEVFAHGDCPVNWPEPPAGFEGPISTISEPPYQLALYATNPLRAVTLGTAERLGWGPH